MKTRKFEIQSGGFFTKSHSSSDTTRLIFEDVDGNFHLVKAGEALKTGLFASTVMKLYGFNLGNDIVEFDFSGQVTSKDGIKLTGAVSLTVSVFKNDEKIFRLFHDEKTENELLRTAVIHFVQKFTNTIDAVKIKGNVSTLTEFLYKQKSDVSNLNDSCYDIVSFTIKNLDLQDKELNDLMNKTVKDIQREEHTKQITTIKLEKTDIEQKFKEGEIKGQLELDKIKDIHKIELDKHKSEADLELQHKKALANIEIEKAQLELQKLKKQTELFNKLEESKILATEEGKIALFPKEMFDLLTKEVEVAGSEESGKQKLLTNFINQWLQSGTSFKAGQLDAMKQILANHLNIRLTEYNEISETDITKAISNEKEVKSETVKPDKQEDEQSKN